MHFIVLLFGRVAFGLQQFRKQLPMPIAARSKAFAKPVIHSAA
jgi:hypothetical protein